MRFKNVPEIYEGPERRISRTVEEELEGYKQRVKRVLTEEIEDTGGAFAGLWNAKREFLEMIVSVLAKPRKTDGPEFDPVKIMDEVVAGKRAERIAEELFSDDDKGNGSGSFEA